jgi:hypothetical protein
MGTSSSSNRASIAGQSLDMAPAKRPGPTLPLPLRTAGGVVVRRPREVVQGAAEVAEVADSEADSSLSALMPRRRRRRRQLSTTNTEVGKKQSCKVGSASID